MTKKKLILLIIVVLLSFQIKAQDIHFSQFFATPLNTNPANTGYFDGDFRLIFNNKNQWQSFADAYRTFAFSFDAGFENFLIKKSISGIGLQVNTDIAGSGKLMTNQFYLNMSYYFPLNKDKNIFLGIGAAPGYVLQQIDFNRLTFGTQYQNEVYNPDNDPDEIFATNKINYFDVGCGINFVCEKNPKFQPQIGLSIFHLTQPYKSFSLNSNRFLPIKYMVNAKINWQVVEKFWLEPMFLFMFQDKYSEYTVGLMSRYEHALSGFQTLYFGVTCRAKDAAILYLGAKYQNISVFINYDINFSKLTTISRGKGGFELSIMYVIARKKTFVSPYYRKCPDFL